MGRGHQLNSVALQHSMGPLDTQNLNLVGKCPASSKNNNNIFYLNMVSFKANIAYGVIVLLIGNILPGHARYGQLQEPITIGSCQL